VSVTATRTGNIWINWKKSLAELNWLTLRKIPADVITMRSKVSLKDLKSGQTVMYSLVFPSEANSNEGRISVLAPIGTALLGNRSGDVVESRVPSGLRRLKVKEILYQPEAAGNYNE